jgi:hypothetical protein
MSGSWMVGLNECCSINQRDHRRAFKTHHEFCTTRHIATASSCTLLMRGVVVSGVMIGLTKLKISVVTSELWMFPT